MKLVRLFFLQVLFFFDKVSFINFKIVTSR